MLAYDTGPANMVIDFLMQKLFEKPYDEGGKIAKGRPIQNLINIEKEDKVRAVINVPTLTDQEFINNNFLIMCTDNLLLFIYFVNDTHSRILSYSGWQLV